MQILVVCMFDSIHTARWLSQFTNSNINIKIFPSTHFKEMNPELSKLVHSGAIKSALRIPVISYKFLGYIDTALFRLMGKLIPAINRASFLRRVIRNEEFDYLHLIEFQHAGYLYLESKTSSPSFKIILTNWGSDIYFFMHEETHVSKIRKLLSIADFYSAECLRDYKLAKDFGFAGGDLPLIPNAGGFSVAQNFDSILSIRNRKQILVKCNTGQFGLGFLLLGVATKFLKLNQEFTFHLYSVGEDLMSSARRLEYEFPNRIKITSSSRKMTHQEMQSEFSKSIAYIGASRSDGISTAFLEALVNGCFPIQTNTSCAGEWRDQGFLCKVTDAREEDLLDALCSTVENFDLLESAQKVNWELSRKLLSQERISQESQKFYRPTGARNQL